MLNHSGIIGTLRNRMADTPWAVLLVAAYVFLATNVDLAPDLQWHDGQRLGQLVLMGLFAFAAFACLGQSICGTWLSLPGWVRYALVLVLFLGALSSILASFPRWAFLEWGMMVMLVIMALGVAGVCRASERLRAEGLVLFCFATALAYCVKSGTVYFSMLLIGPSYEMSFAVEDLFPGFSNVRFFGHLQTMLLPFLVLPALWWGKSPARLMLLMVVPALWWSLAIASGTRGSWVALLIGMLAVVAMHGAGAGRWLRLQLLGFTGGAVVYGLFVVLLPTWFFPTASFMFRGSDLFSLSGRETLWRLSVDIVSEQPWLGIGPMHFANQLSRVAAHPHNAVLQLMVEWGVPAAMLLTAVWATAGLSWAMRVRRMGSSPTAAHDQQPLTAAALLAALTGAAAQAMVDGIIVMPVSQVCLVLMTGWALGWSNSGHDVPIVAKGSILVFRGLTFLAVLVLLFGIWPELGHIEERRQANLHTVEPGPMPRLLPRFWIHGWIND
jgi:O-antigen ligase